MAKNSVFIVDKKHADQRIDKYLGERLAAEFSRTELKKIIQEHNVLLNNKVVKPHQKVRENDTITVKAPPTHAITEVPPVNIPLDIIYEDEYLMLVNKPAGIVVHPAAGHHKDTLVNALLFYTRSLSDINGPFKLGIVHRLDKDTSGILLIAKDNKTHRHLARQFKTHRIKKKYVAVVKGALEHDEGIIDAPLSRSPFDRKKMRVCHASSRTALTRYRLIKRRKDFSVVEIYPATGRTHQIRVHMAHIGHPLLADTCYGQRGREIPLKRQALHAQYIGFIHPHTKDFLEFEAPLPEDMLQVINAEGFA